MWWMIQIIIWLQSVRDWLLNAYYTVNGWIWPFKALATPLYYIYVAFFYLALYFVNFQNWIIEVTNRLSQILSITQITSYFQTWITYATTAYNWVVSATTNVRLILDSWWREASQQVYFAIEQAKYWVLVQLNNLAYNYAAVQAWWNDFCTYTWPQWLASLQSLWNSFTAFVASIGQTILSHLNAFWSSTIFPAFESIWQTLAALHIPTWDEIRSFIFSSLPGIADILNWWNEFYKDVKEFFLNPLDTLAIWLHLEEFADLLDQGIAEMEATEDTIEEEFDEDIDPIAIMRHEANLLMGIEQEAGYTVPESVQTLANEVIEDIKAGRY